MQILGSPGPLDCAAPSDAEIGSSTLPFFDLQQRKTSEDFEDMLETSQKNRMQVCKTQDSPQELLLYLNYNDQHSSEEELEVINGPKVIALQYCRPATAREKRKWSEVSNSNVQTQCQSQQQLQECDSADVLVASCSAPVSRAGKETCSSSSDEEVM